MKAVSRKGAKEDAKAQTKSLFFVFHGAFAWKKVLI
jgi:hypothetical protein